MLQQTKIVIDFQEIFDNSQDQHAFSMAQTQSHKLELDIKHDLTEPLPDPPSKDPQPNYSSIALTSATSYKPCQIPIPLALSFESERNSRLLSTTAIISRKKRSSPSRVSAITEKLSIPKKDAMVTLKTEEKKEEKCKRIQLINSRKKNEKRSKSREPSQKTSLDVRSRSCNADIFQRLYFDSKLKSIERKYRPGPEVSPKINHSPKNNGHNSQYLKTYVPFYSRLQSEINLSLEKAKMYKDLSGWTQGRKPFTPNVRPNKYTNKVKSRYMETPDYARDSNKQIDLENSSLGSSLGSLSKSDKMMTLMEQHFLKKMECVFVEEGEETVEITVDKIRLLTEVEFEVLEVFIRYLDENPIPPRQFNNYLVSYFDSLTTADKLKLRTHELQMKYKYQPVPKKPQKRKQAPVENKIFAKTQSRILQKTAKDHTSTYQFI